MAGNSFGKLFRLTTFGESHGPAIGGVVDGCPSGIAFDFEFIRTEMRRRKPGQSKIVTQRKEHDEVEFLSGIFEGKTTGAPIGFLIRNTDARSSDYDALKEVYRPSHADYTYDAKFGFRDYRGGGRSSARETACRVVGGAIAKMILAHHKIKVQAWVSQVGHLTIDKDYSKLDLSRSESNMIRCPDAVVAQQMIALIESVRKEGDTVGGVVSALIEGVQPGLGEPVFDRLHADLGKAMLSINAVKGFDYGSGFDAPGMRGSQHNDAFVPAGNANKIATLTNNSGGIQGGISNGEDIYFRVAFKPVATIIRKQTTVNRKGQAVEMMGKGRHDPCVVPRAVSVVEAMAALVILDHLLRAKALRTDTDS
ncbi:MAG TPA: chorismate synthase [Bacteroidia bacterium]|nr:chorismate synthase [Bacteroidia bacterium]